MLLFLLAACGGSSAGDCDLATYAAGLAGNGATDCGAATLSDDPATVDACAVGAYQAGDAFFARWQLQGIDSEVWRGVASDGATLWFLTWDSDPSGGSKVGAVMSQDECASPEVVTDTGGHETLDCAAWGDSTQACG